MIWCIEDDSGIRNMMIYTLRAAGFEADGFPDGAAFFEALTESRPELILLDIMLPGEDGISILGKLRQKAETAAIPVIMATAKEVDFEQSTIVAEFWHGLYCYEKSTMEGQRTFPMTEQGRAEMYAWLTENI